MIVRPCDTSGLIYLDKPKQRCGRLGRGAYAVPGRLPSGGIVVSSCGSTVRIPSRPRNAQVTRVPVRRRRIDRNLGPS